MPVSSVINIGDVFSGRNHFTGAKVRVKEIQEGTNPSLQRIITEVLEGGDKIYSRVKDTYQEYIGSFLVGFYNTSLVYDLSVGDKASGVKQSNMGVLIEIVDVKTTINEYDKTTPIKTYTADVIETSENGRANGYSISHIIEFKDFACNYALVNVDRYFVLKGDLLKDQFKAALGHQRTLMNIIPKSSSLDPYYSNTCPEWTSEQKADFLRHLLGG